MDLTVNGGAISAGRYDTVVVNGDARMEPDVAFGLLRLRSGTLTATRLRGGVLECAGVVRCSQDMVVGHVRGHGILLVDGDLVCRTMRFVGTLRCRGSIRCAADLHVDGRLEDRRDIEARNMTLVGVLDAGDLRTGALALSPFEGHLLRRLGMTEYLGGSRARTVRAANVEASGLTCRSIMADQVTLRDGSQAGRVLFTRDLSLDASSDVALMRKDPSSDVALDEAFLEEGTPLEDRGRSAGRAPSSRSRDRQRRRA